MDIKNLIDLKDKTFYAAVRWRGSINATTQSQKQERVLFVIVIYLMLLTPLSFTGLEYFVKFYNVLKGILTYLNLSHLYSTHVER